MRNVFSTFGIVALVAAFGIALAACDNGNRGPEIPGNVVTNARIAVTGIPADHYDADSENEYLRGGMMTIRDGDGEPVATGIADVIDGSMAVELVDGDDPWDGSGGHFIELTFSYFGGSYYYTGGQDFSALLPPTFDPHNDDLSEHLPLFNITGEHSIALSQFRHSSTLTAPGPSPSGEVKITITGIPADHYDADDENENLRGGMMMIYDNDGEVVATGSADVIDGSMTVELMDGDDPWDGSGAYFIELTFSYYGGSYHFTNGDDFSAILPPTFDKNNDELFDHLPTFNITGTHSIALTQFRHSGTIPEPTFTVTFNSGDGSAVANQTGIASGGLATLPPPPTRARTSVPDEAGLWGSWFPFVEWRHNGTAWDFDNYEVTENITLTAHWNEETLTTQTNIAGIITFVNDNAELGPFTLLMGANMTTAAAQTIGEGVHLTIAGHGERRTITRASGIGGLFSLNGTDRSLTLGDNVTLVGHAGNNNPLVNVAGGASLTMNAGAWITGNTSTGASSAGGVTVTGSGSVFTMNGGTIFENTSTTNATGTGVRVAAGARFYMHPGAVIRDNENEGGNTGSGGVFVTGAGSAFTMHGGEISGNSAVGINVGGGVSVFDGAVFRMVNGVIYGENEGTNSNVASNASATSFDALRVVGDNTVAELGTMVGDTFTPTLDDEGEPVTLTSTDDTIRVVNGELQP